MGLRLTKGLIGKILDANEGFKDTTSYSSRNFSETNRYEITGGKLMKRSTGKTSWADSRFDETSECDIDQTRRFLRDRLDQLNTDFDD